jgi:hypothetical protein
MTDANWLFFIANFISGDEIYCACPLPRVVVVANLTFNWISLTNECSVGSSWLLDGCYQTASGLLASRLLDYFLLAVCLLAA